MNGNSSHFIFELSIVKGSNLHLTLGVAQESNEDLTPLLYLGKFVLTMAQRMWRFVLSLKFIGVKAYGCS
jgi:hypothetical protein